MSRRPGVVAVSALALVAALVVGVRLVADSPDTGSRPPRRSTAPGTHAEPTHTAASSTVVVPAYFVGASATGPRLFAVQRGYRADGTDQRARLEAAVDGVLRGDSGRSDRTSPWPDGTTAVVSRDGDTVNVDLTSPGDLSARDEDDAAVALQAVVWTVDAVLDEDAPVTFTVDGAPTDVLLGQDASAPVGKADPLEVLSLVRIEEPDALTDDAGSPFTVTGQAAASEAALTWRLRRGDQVVRRGTATTQECCTFSPFSFRVRAPAGRYTLEVSDTDDSGAGRTNADSVDVTVR